MTRNTRINRSIFFSLLFMFVTIALAIATCRAGAQEIPSSPQVMPHIYMVIARPETGRIGVLVANDQGVVHTSMMFENSNGTLIGDEWLGGCEYIEDETPCVNTSQGLTKLGWLEAWVIQVVNTGGYPFEYLPNGDIIKTPAWFYSQVRRAFAATEYLGEPGNVGYDVELRPVAVFAEFDFPDGRCEMRWAGYSWVIDTLPSAMENKAVCRTAWEILNGAPLPPPVDMQNPVVFEFYLDMLDLRLFQSSAYPQVLMPLAISN